MFWIFVLVNTVMASSSLAFSGGNQAGNGGDVLVCQDGSVQMLDYFEAKVLDQRPMRYPVGTDEIEIAQAFLEHGLVHFPRLRERWTKDLNSIGDKIQFVDNFELEDVADSDHLLKPRGCEVKQIAIRQTRFQNLREYLVDRNLWGRLNLHQKGILLLHEVIYRDLVVNGEAKNSIELRKIVGVLISETPLVFQSIDNLIDYFANSLKFKYFEISGALLPSYAYVKICNFRGYQFEDCAPTRLTAKRLPLGTVESGSAAYRFIPFSQALLGMQEVSYTLDSIIPLPLAIERDLVFSYDDGDIAKCSFTVDNPNPVKTERITINCEEAAPSFRSPDGSKFMKGSYANPLIFSKSEGIQLILKKYAMDLEMEVYDYQALRSNIQSLGLKSFHDVSNQVDREERSFLFKTTKNSEITANTPFPFRPEFDFAIGNNSNLAPRVARYTAKGCRQLNGRRITAGIEFDSATGEYYIESATFDDQFCIKPILQFSGSVKISDLPAHTEFSVAAVRLTGSNVQIDFDKGDGITGQSIWANFEYYAQDYRRVLSPYRFHVEKPIPFKTYYEISSEIIKYHDGPFPEICQKLKTYFVRAGLTGELQSATDLNVSCKLSAN